MAFQWLRQLRAELGQHSDEEFMSPVDAAASSNRSLPRIGLYLICLLILAALIWASQAELDTVTRGEGKVVPSSQTKVVQNLEGGILARMEVKEGDLVKANQVLLEIDDAQTLASQQEVHARRLALAATLARLQAEAFQAKLVFPTEVRQERPDLVAHEAHLYRVRQQKLAREQQMFRTNLALLQQESAMTTPLLRAGAIAPLDVLHLNQKINDVTGNMAILKAHFLAETMLQFNETKTEHEKVVQTARALEDKMARRTVRAPVAGIVKKVHVTTLGGIISPAQNILEIVPVEDNLLVEARIAPQDIAFLAPGQKGVVKVSAYDFSIYGGLEGIVEYIGADTLLDEKTGESFYVIRLRTQKNHLTRNGRQLPILPGMTVTAEVLGERRTVLEYLLKPFNKMKEKAFSER